MHVTRKCFEIRLWFNHIWVLIVPDILIVPNILIAPNILISPNLGCDIIRYDLWFNMVRVVIWDGAGLSEFTKTVYSRVEFRNVASVNVGLGAGYPWVYSKFRAIRITWGLKWFGFGLRGGKMNWFWSIWPENSIGLRDSLAYAEFTVYPVVGLMMADGIRVSDDTRLVHLFDNSKKYSTVNLAGIIAIYLNL